MDHGIRIRECILLFMLPEPKNKQHDDKNEKCERTQENDGIDSFQTPS